MCFDEVVAKGLDFVQGQLIAGVRVEVRCLIDVFFLTRNCGLDRHIMYGDMGHIQACKLVGNVADNARVHTVRIHHNGDFDAGVCGQVGDKTRVLYVAVDLVGNPRFARFHNTRAVLARAFVFDVFGFHNIFSLLFPVADLVYAATGIFVEGDIKAFDKLGVVFFNEVRVIFGGMFAAFGVVIAESVHYLQTNEVVFRFYFVKAFF